MNYSPAPPHPWNPNKFWMSKVTSNIMIVCAWIVFFLFCWLDIIELLQQNLNSFFTVWVGNLKQSLADTVRNICFRKRYNVLCWFSLKFMNLFQDPQFSQKVFFFQLKEKLRKNTPPFTHTLHPPYPLSNFLDCENRYRNIFEHTKKVNISYATSYRQTRVQKKW